MKKFDLGINTEYAKIFPKSNSSVAFTLNQILIIEEKLNKDLFKWKEEDIMEYLKSFDSTSPMTLNTKINILRSFADFISDKKGVKKRNFTICENGLIKCINVEKLMAVTINYEQYQKIRQQMNVDGNVRDKLIFEFGWCGLTNEQIKYIKESDVKFVKTELPWEICEIQIDGNTIKIEDPEVVEDIKTVLKETVYTIYAKDNKKKLMKYKDSDYLLKPIQVGKSKSKKENYITNPSLTLQSVFNNDINWVTCKDVDIERLSLEDIRRSKIIYLLADKNFTMEKIAKLFGLQSESNLYWLQRVANKKYKGASEF
jgi:hypothetical protein